MTVLYPIRKARPVYGKPMKVVPDNQSGGERYDRLASLSGIKLQTKSGF